MTRNELRRLKYALVRNAYGDKDLAYKYRERSISRIFLDLGVEVSGTKIPELKELDHTKDAYYQRKLNKFQYATSIGHDVVEARRLTNYSNQKIKSSLDMIRIIRRTERTDSYQNRKVRTDLWASWSTSGPNGESNMPPSIDKIARQYNREQKFDDYDKYGYYFAFYLFVENQDEETIKQIMEPDKFTGGVKYVTHIRVPT